MSNLLARVQWSDDPVIGVRQTRVADLIAQIEAKADPADLMRSEALEPADLIAALAATALGGDNATGPALVQCRPSQPHLEHGLMAVARLWKGSNSPTAHLVVTAGLLQIFDFWEASHTAAQEADDRGDTTKLGSLWHAIAHRREPDPGNSAYWYRRVGRDPAGIFTALTQPSKQLLGKSGQPGWSNRLISNGRWDPMAFIEITNQAQPGTSEETLARKLQRLEMLLALEASL